MRTTLQFWNVPRPGEVKGSSALGYGGNREHNGGVGEFRGCGDVRGLETMLWFWKLLQGEWKGGLRTEAWGTPLWPQPEGQQEGRGQWDEGLGVLFLCSADRSRKSRFL